MGKAISRSTNRARSRRPCDCRQTRAQPSPRKTMRIFPHAPRGHITRPFVRRHGRAAHDSFRHEPHTMIHDCRNRHTTCWLGPLSLSLLPRVQESLAASHKCHPRVCHIGRVFNLPYKFNAVGYVVETCWKWMLLLSVHLSL